MTNHPNRNKKVPHPSRNPTPAEIIAGRKARGLTQTEAAAVIHCGLRAWQEWEAGGRRIHPAFWELFLRKTRVLPETAPESPPEEEPPKAE
jgi:DNA (cytosine-5)-methyltransferase 1